MRDPKALEVQYQDDRYLQMRIETHRRYTVGPGIEEAVDHALELAPLDTLLDIGTGPGDFPGRLKASGHTGRAVGADLSCGMLEQARAKYPAVEFVEADAQNLPFESASFDRVSARHMLYHVPNLTQALAEAKRVLKPGGRFLALTNANGNLLGFWQAVMEAVDTNPAFEPLIKDVRSAPFDHNHLLGAIRGVFGNAKLEIVESALLFPDPEPVLNYFDSLRTMRTIPQASWDWGRARLAGVLQTHSWPWRVAKGIALIAAEKQ